MTSRISYTRIICSAILISMVTGCTSMHTIPVSDAQSIRDEVKLGDTVRITRIDGSMTTFKVEEISGNEISGGVDVVAFSDIQSLSVKRTSNAKTIGLIAGIVLIMSVIAEGAAGANLLEGA